MKELIIKELKSIKMVGDAAAEKLYLGGYYSVDDVAVASVGDITDKTGMSKSAAETIIKNALAASEMDVPVTLDTYKDPMGHLSTGSKAIDDGILGGGYLSGIVTEIHGLGGIGKTQSAMTAAVMATRPVSEGGMGCDVLYVDTEGSFTKARIMQIAEARGYNSEDVLSHIHLIKCQTAASQLLMLSNLNNWYKEWNLRCIIVDSAIANFRAEYTGRGTLADRQAMLNRYLHALSIYAREHQAVVLVTNQMESSPGIVYGDPNLPTGGNVFNHNCQCRIRVRKGQGKKLIFHLTKMCMLPSETEAFCSIGKAGIKDA